MSYNKKELKPYLNLQVELIPLHQWNKLIKGKERGKTPVDAEWNSNQYPQTSKAYNKWIGSGYNLGYRIGQQELVVDLDPRNYKEGINSEELVADLFGYLDFEELMWELPVVKTGSGGYHIYCLLPEDMDYKLIRKCVENLPGVDFKKKGGYVVAAGSKHPNGDYYTWENEAKPQVAPQELLDLIVRDKFQTKDYSSGYGAFSGTQLQTMVLDKLDVMEFDSNDTWEPLMMECHHATAGEGIEEFLEWCLGDPDYQDSENQIRNRWESLDDSKDVQRTAASLIKRLKESGEDTSGAKAVLDFGTQPKLELDDEDSEEATLIRESKRIASEIDVSDIYDDPEMRDMEEGAAIQAINELPHDPSSEDIAKCLRLIKNSDMYERARSIELLKKTTGLQLSAIKGMLKELESKINDDLALVLSRKTLEVTFNEGKHLTCPPNGTIYAYRGTHWVPISEDFMAKLVQSTLHTLKDKMEIKAQEVALLSQAVKLSRIAVSTLKDKLHSTDLPKPVINCTNGELWLEKDGSHLIKPHSYRSYLLNCLNVEYNPSAKCPLFMDTLEGIFANFEDTEDMVRHMGEILGYVIQPYKNIASWWLFRGPGSDGKSTILKILGGILQNAQLMTGVKILSAGSDNGYNHALTSLVGKLNVVIEEIPANYYLKDAGLKLLSENTKMEANPKLRDGFDFIYAGNLIMCSNTFPSTREVSHGMFRRAHVIPFNRQFDKTGSEDLDRAAKILNNPEEMSGVLNFMLEGLQRLRNRGRFDPPKSCQAAKEEWMGEANNIVRFVNESIETTKPHHVVCDFGLLYDTYYQLWCQQNDIDDKVRKRKLQFKRDLQSLGFRVDYGGKNILKVYGGRLKEGVFDELEDFDEL